MKKNLFNSRQPYLHLKSLSARLVIRRRDFSLFILLIFLNGFAKAQVPVQGGNSVAGVISGKVLDSLTQDPLDYATVTLYRQNGKAPVNGALTDGKGSFKIENVGAGSYKLTVTFLGYPTKTISPVTTSLTKPDLNFGNIILSADSKTLQAVTVVGETPVVENKIDKVIFNAEKDVTSTGGNAGDVLRKVPLVSVDMDGNVALRGSQNVRILINGKPSGALASNAADVLKSMPADQIRNIEVITSPSAKYDAEGSAGIINIVTKKKNVSGLSGSVSGGIGTRQNNGNVNLNMNVKRLSLSGNLGVNSGWPNTTFNTFNSQNTELSTYSSSFGTNESSRHFTMGSGSLGYDFNNYNSFTSSLSLRGGSFSNDGSTTNNNTSPETGTVQYTSGTTNDFSLGSFDWNSEFTHKFKRAGEELSVAGQWSHSKADINYASTYTAFTENQKADNIAKNDEYTVQADYTLPISKAFKIETGTKGIFRNINSNYAFFNPDASGNYVFNPASSNNYRYNQDVYSGYGVLSVTLKNGYGIQAGARVENTRISGISNNVNIGLQPFNNNYTNLVPNLAVSKTLKDGQTIKLSYNKRIQRPSLRFLNPFRNTSNPLNQQIGNPELSPEISQSIEFSYSTLIKGSAINASVYYTRTNNLIESYITTVPFTTVDNAGNTVTRNVSLTNYGNIGKNNSIGASVFGSVTFAKAVTLRGNFNVFTYNPHISAAFQSQSPQTGTTYVQYNASLTGGLKLPKGFSAETFVMQNSPRRTFQGENPSFSIWTIGLKKEILNRKGSIGLNVVQPFNDRKSFTTNINNGPLTQYNEFSVPFRSVGLNFSWNFGKMNYGQQPARKKKGINNDDLKQGDNNGQGAM
jgi:outer membrane receptor protein involved in Fe transport